MVIRPAGWSACILAVFLFCSTCTAQETSLSDLKQKAWKFYQKRNYETAIAITKQALQIAERKYGKDSMEAAEFLGNLGALYRLEDKGEQGQQLLKRARDIRFRHGTSAVPVGIETEAFFDQVYKPADGAVQGEYKGPVSDLCDYDRDGDCDESDLTLLKKSMVHCKEEVLPNGTVVNNFDKCMPEQSQQMMIDNWKSDAKAASGDNMKLNRTL